MKNRLFKIIFILFIILLFELLLFFIINAYRRNKISKEYGLKIDVERLNHEKEKKELSDDFEKNKYLATGKNAYERIYNSREKDIMDLIQRLSLEALPPNWKSEVKVEEFTNVILLIQNPRDEKDISINELTKYLIPILTYGGQYLKNVAVFNRKHQSYLYFDEEALDELIRNQTLSEKTIADIKNKGTNFTRYNAIKIDYEEKFGHIFIPVIVSGKYGSYECIMMLDTGASMTVISLELAQKTGQEDLNKVERRSFSTAKGLLSCPIVAREIIVGSLDRKQPVAVNVEDNSNLLGVDFFESKGYVIDADSKSIYVWSK